MVVTITPLVAVIAAGNCAVIKPSEFSPASSNYINKLVTKYLDNRFYRCIEGGVQTSIALTNIAFDKIMFTGGTATGK